MTRVAEEAPYGPSRRAHRFYAYSILQASSDNSGLARASRQETPTRTPQLKNAPILLGPLCSAAAEVLLHPCSKVVRLPHVLLASFAVEAVHHCFPLVLLGRVVLALGHVGRCWGLGWEEKGTRTTEVSSYFTRQMNDNT